MISYALPLTRGVEAARLAVAGGPPSQTAGLLAGEFAVGMVYELCGYALFRILESYSRRGGLQEAY